MVFKSLLIANKIPLSKLSMTQQQVVFINRQLSGAHKTFCTIKSNKTKYISGLTSSTSHQVPSHKHKKYLIQVY